jgi:hypothetical protein
VRVREVRVRVEKAKGGGLEKDKENNLTPINHIVSVPLPRHSKKVV